MGDRPVRVLHVVGGLERGGAETWMVQLLECLDRRRIQADVLVHRRGGVYEERVRASGAQILYCGQPSHLLKYMSALRGLLREKGPYDVLHSHLQLYSGLILRIAHEANVPGRIAHARNSNDGQGRTIHRVMYRALMRHWIKRYATHLFAVSTEAAEGAFWKGVVHDGRCRVMTGIDFTVFQSQVDRAQIRAELGLPAHALVVGHVGSFRRQKNHEFLLKIAQEVLVLCPDSIFLLVGEGALRRSIQEAVRTLGIEQHVRFLGERDDVPRLLQAMDVFVFPSLYEGLPRVLLEAQAVGLSCVASSVITPESAAEPNSIVFLSLQEDPRVWAKSVIMAAQEPPSAAKGIAAIHRFEERGISIAANAKELTDLYEAIAGIGAAPHR